MRALTFWVSATLCFAVLSACSTPPPEPYIPCLSDQQCPKGRCLDGLCVNDDAAGNPSDSIAGSDATSEGCLTAEDCPTLDTPCLVSVCDLGVCSLAPLPNEVTCTTQSICPAAGICKAGNCLPNGAACDDNNPCTADQCTGTGCKHVNFPSGTFCQTDELSCSAGVCELGECKGSVVAEFCKIAKACYLSGD
ncbi:MAG TPA: hypothetical protein DCQ06_11180, partial [Myxococcales bacterium]|nr:hypothetical protein [Myxococcales bacterium]